MDEERDKGVSRRGFLRGALAGAVALGLGAAGISSGDRNNASAEGSGQVPTKTPAELYQDFNQKDEKVEAARASGRIELNGDWDQYFIPVSPDIAKKLQTESGQDGFLFPFDPSRLEKLVLEVKKQQVNGEEKEVVAVSNVTNNEFIYSPFKGNVKAEESADGSREDISLEGYDYGHPRIGKGQAPIPTRQTFELLGSSNNLVFFAQEAIYKDEGELDSFQKLGLARATESDSGFAFRFNRPDPVYNQQPEKQLNFATYKGKIAFLKTSPPHDASNMPGPVIIH